MDKQALRKLYLEKRRTLTNTEIEKMSIAIAEHFSLLYPTNAKYIHLFYPIAAKHEVNSLKIAEWLRSNHPEIKIVLPKSNLHNHSFHHILWDDDTQLITNRWGITEPVSGEEVKAEMIDAVVIPLLAYDMEGNRVGYGKGFYDKFLAECRKNVQKIGLSFFDPEEE